MRIAFDMDGTLTEGKYLPAPRKPIDYMSLAPFDKDTKDIWNQLSINHDLFIITARSAHDDGYYIQEWLDREGMYPANTIITNPFPGRGSIETGPWKYDLAKLLGCTLVFDDNPVVHTAFHLDCYDTSPGKFMTTVYLVNNPHWERNQVYEADRVKSWKEIHEAINYHSQHASRPTL